MEKSEFATIFGDRPAATPREAGPLPFENYFFQSKATGAGAFAKRTVETSFLDDALGISDLALAKTTPVPRTVESATTFADIWRQALGLFDLETRTATAPAVPAVQDEFRKRQRPLRKTQAEHRKALSKILESARAAFPTSIRYGDGWDRVLDSCAQFVDESVRLFA